MKHYFCHAGENDFYVIAAANEKDARARLAIHTRSAQGTRKADSDLHRLLREAQTLPMWEIRFNSEGVCYIPYDWKAQYPDIDQIPTPADDLDAENAHKLPKLGAKPVKKAARQPKTSKKGTPAAAGGEYVARIPLPTE